MIKLDCVPKAPNPTTLDKINQVRCNVKILVKYDVVILLREQVCDSLAMVRYNLASQVWKISSSQIV
jgi:hypothetical protein